MKIITVDNRPDLAELLILLQEEAAEVSQAASKLIRFGLGSHLPSKDFSNLQELSKELTDLLAVIGLLCNGSDIGITINEIADEERIHAKLKKISTYTTYWPHAHDFSNL